MYLKPIKIAIVDDDQIYQFIMQRTLSKLHPDSKILNFSNCADFFNFLKRHQTSSDLLPDLVLLDLNSPFMCGWEFLESYESIQNSSTKKIDIYLVTSSVDPKDQIKSQQYPLLEGFFNKPIAPETLSEIIGLAQKKSL